MRSGRVRESGLWPCQHCGAERELLPLSVMLGLARKHGFVTIVDAITDLLAAGVEREQTIGVCPSCSCVAPIGVGRHRAA